MATVAFALARLTPASARLTAASAHWNSASDTSSSATAAASAAAPSTSACDAASAAAVTFEVDTFETRRGEHVADDGAASSADESLQEHNVGGPSLSLPDPLNNCLAGVSSPTAATASAVIGSANFAGVPPSGVLLTFVETGSARSGARSEGDSNSARRINSANAAFGPVFREERLSAEMRFGVTAAEPRALLAS